MVQSRTALRRLLKGVHGVIGLAPRWRAAHGGVRWPAALDVALLPGLLAAGLLSGSSVPYALMAVPVAWAIAGVAGWLNGSTALAVAPRASLELALWWLVGLFAVIAVPMWATADGPVRVAEVLVALAVLFSSVWQCSGPVCDLAAVLWYCRAARKGAALLEVTLERRSRVDQIKAGKWQVTVYYATPLPHRWSAADLGNALSDDNRFDSFTHDVVVVLRPA